MKSIKSKSTTKTPCKAIIKKKIQIKEENEDSDEDLNDYLQSTGSLNISTMSSVIQHVKRYNTFFLKYKIYNSII